VLIGKIKRNCRQAIELDSTNARAYFAFASNEYHMPEKLGGGKETESYLLKAISISSKKNGYLPTWGKEESYELLIKWYIRKEMNNKAKEYFFIAKKEFSNSYRINQLSNLF
jgi:hypothetical protein